MKPHRGTLILVLGIVSIFVCGIILGPIAWVMGNNDLREMSAGTMDPSGKRHDQRWQNLRNDCPVPRLFGTAVAKGESCPRGDRR